MPCVGVLDQVRGLVEGVGELDERGTVRLARDGARREAAVLPQDPPRAPEGVERGVGGGGGGAVVADGVVELDVGRGVVDDDGGGEADLRSEKLLELEMSDCLDLPAFKAADRLLWRALNQLQKREGATSVVEDPPRRSGSLRLP